MDKLTSSDIEKILAHEDMGFDWESYHDWLSNPQMPFQKPIIMENGATIWGYCTIHPNAKIGKNTVIGAFTNICGPVEIGDEVRMQGFNYIPQGITIESRVFIGPSVVFTNVKYPSARGNASRGRLFEEVLVKKGASLGAGAVICPSVTIGEAAMVAAGSVVTRDVLAGWLVKGNPARHVRPVVNFKEEEEQRKAWKIKEL